MKSIARICREYMLKMLRARPVQPQEIIEITVPKVGGLEGCLTTTAWSKQTIYQFLGVPYAEPPSKCLRFKPPVRRSVWKGVRDATKYGSPCPSLCRNPKKQKFFMAEMGDPEDCLNLCIYTKDLYAKNAVMVYIHGGSFVSGSASTHFPHYLLEKDIVLVVPQYRLGALGFLSTGTADIAGNMGLMDLKLALEWIQEHISYFGGDSNRVTLFGQSSGAALVTGLMISPMISKQLFHRTIVQSGSVIAGWSTTPDLKLKAREICERLGCKNCKCFDVLHECLINSPVTKLIEASMGQSKGPNLIPFSLTTEDFYNFLPLPVEQLAASGTSYPMIAGVTKHEGSLALQIAYDYLKQQKNNKIHPSKFIDLLIQEMREKDRGAIIANLAKILYFNSSNLNEQDYTCLIPGLIDFAGMISMKSPLLRFAQLNAHKGGSPTYLYTFDYSGQHSNFGLGCNSDIYPFEGGVCHSNENIYLFATHKLNEEDEIIARTMVELWTSFATNGVPKAENVDNWVPISGISCCNCVEN